jgi:predicted nucleic acid-binding protein
VLYPAPLRDLLMQLAMTGLFRARWTDRIHDEWIRNVLANRPDLKPSQLQRTRELMNAHAMDCLVTGYEKFIAGLSLPDAKDRHVLAAAIRSNATVIVTFNLKDFPASAIGKYGVEAQHPDVFVGHLLDLDSASVCAAVNRQRRSLRNPPRTTDELLDTLEAQGLSRSVRRLRGLAELC